MEMPNRKPKIRIGTKVLTEPVAAIPHRAWVPMPCWKTRTTMPKVAATDSALSATAFRAARHGVLDVGQGRAAVRGRDLVGWYRQHHGAAALMPGRAGRGYRPAQAGHVVQRGDHG